MTITNLPMGGFADINLLSEFFLHHEGAHNNVSRAPAMTHGVHRDIP
jgi:hypothetical protein